MRGEVKNFKTLVISGKVYLRFEDDPEEIIPASGDVVFFLSTDSDTRKPMQGEYYRTGSKGYLKLDIFDGKSWQPLILADFFEQNENHYSKKERPIDTFNLCCSIFAQFVGKPVYKIYREHYTLKEYIPNPFKGKKANYKEKQS